MSVAKQAIKNSPRKFPLLKMLVIPFVLQLVAAMSIVGWLSFKSGEKSVHELANQLRHAVSGRINQRLDIFLGSSRRINQVNLGVFKLGTLDIKNLDSTERYFYQQLKTFKHISYINFASVWGNFVGVGRKDDGSFYVDVIEPSRPDIYNRYALDEQGDRTKRILTEKYDYMRDAWYADAVKAGKPLWSDIHELNSLPGMYTISSTYPMYDKNNKLVGVLGVDVILTQITDFLKKLEVSPSVKIFIMERDGKLVASSGKEKGYIIKDGKRQRMSVFESREPLIQATGEYLQQHFGNFMQIQSDQWLNFQQNGERKFVQVVPWKDDLGLDWLIVIAVPESAFMGNINANARNTIMLCLVAFVAEIGVGILTSRLIARPILNVAQASENMAGGNLDQKVEPSNIIELDKLANSFNSMAFQLKGSLETLEEKNQALEEANESLRLAEENYRSIFENALEGIFQGTPDGRFIRINPAMARIYGYDSPQEMMASITKIGAQIYVEVSSLNEFYRRMQEKGEVKSFEYQAYLRDRSIIWVQEDARAVCDSSGNVLYYEGIIQDITQRKRKKKDLQRQLQELRVEIDQKKREQEVAQITQSDYFQELQQAAASLQVDDDW